MQSYSLFDSVWSVGLPSSSAEGSAQKEMVVGSPMLSMYQPTVSNGHVESSPSKGNPSKMPMSSGEQQEHHHQQLGHQKMMQQQQQQIRIMQNGHSNVAPFSPMPEQMGMLPPPPGMTAKNPVAFNGPPQMQHMAGMNRQQMMQQQNRLQYQSQLSNQIQMQQQMPGQQIKGQPMPGQQMPGQQMAGQQMAGLQIQPPQQKMGGMQPQSMFQKQQQQQNNRMYVPPNTGNGMNGMTNNGMAHSPNAQMRYHQMPAPRQKQNPIGVPIQNSINHQNSIHHQNSMYESMSPSAVNYGVIGQSPRPASSLLQTAVAGSPHEPEWPLLANGNLSPLQGGWSTATMQESPKKHAASENGGRSIWSSNFALGQGALSPLEQLLQEQRRHQRPK